MEKKYVNIKSGKYRNAKISGVFPLVKDVSFGKKGAFITVDASNQFAGLGNIRVLLNDVNNVEHVDAVVAEAELGNNTPVEETKEQAVDRIRRRFDILQEMTRAVIKGTVRGLILSGPPGVGKTQLTHIIAKIYKVFLPLYPLLVENFDLSKYDLVISTSSSVAKGCIVPPYAKHVCYIHSPMRYVWDRQHEYFKKTLSVFHPIDFVKKIF